MSPTYIPPKTFLAGEYLTFTELNAAIGSLGGLDFLKGALAAIGITADSGNQTVDGAMIGCRVYSSGNLQVRDNTWTRIPWSAQRFGRFDGRDFNYLAPEYPTLVHFPTSTTPIMNGYWLIGAHVEFSPNVTGQRGVRIVVQGYPTDLDRADVIAVRRTDSIGAGSAMALSVPTQWRFVGGSNLAVEVFQDSGADLTINAASSYSAELWAVRMGTYMTA